MHAKLSSTARLVDLLLKICGGSEAAAKAIGCGPDELHSWRMDRGKPDARAFERIVDIIIDFQQRQIDEQGANLRRIQPGDTAKDSKL